MYAYLYVKETTTHKYINYVMCFFAQKKNKTYKFRNLCSLMSHNLTLCSNIESYYLQNT